MEWNGMEFAFSYRLSSNTGFAFAIKQIPYIHSFSLGHLFGYCLVFARIKAFSGVTLRSTYSIPWEENPCLRSHCTKQAGEEYSEFGKRSGTI